LLGSLQVSACLLAGPEVSAPAKPGIEYDSALRSALRAGVLEHGATLLRRLGLLLRHDLSSARALNAAHTSGNERPGSMRETPRRIVVTKGRRCRTPCQETPASRGFRARIMGHCPSGASSLCRRLLMFSALRSRNYALFWVGSFVSNVGTWMQTVALGWVIYEMTGSASWLGTVSFAANAPALFTGLVGGAVADRADRKLLLVGTQAAAAAAAFLLALLTLRGSLEIWRVIAIALGSGLALSFYTPVVHATIPSLVPAEDLLNAVSLNSVQFNLARIIGPVAAGFAYSRIGAAGCFWLNGLSFLVLAISLARLRLPPRSPARAGSLRS